MEYLVEVLERMTQTINNSTLVSVGFGERRELESAIQGPGLEFLDFYDFHRYHQVNWDVATSAVPSARTFDKVCLMGEFGLGGQAIDEGTGMELSTLLFHMSRDEAWNHLLRLQTTLTSNTYVDLYTQGYLGGFLWEYGLRCNVEPSERSSDEENTPVGERVVTPLDELRPEAPVWADRYPRLYTSDTGVLTEPPVVDAIRNLDLPRVFPDQQYIRETNPSEQGG
jgi:hypothetical protein